MIRRLINCWRLVYVREGDLWVECYRNRKGDTWVTSVGKSPDKPWLGLLLRRPWLADEGWGFKRIG